MGGGGEVRARQTEPLERERHVVARVIENELFEPASGFLKTVLYKETPTPPAHVNFFSNSDYPSYIPAPPWLP